MLTTPALEHPTRKPCKHCGAPWTAPASGYNFTCLHEADCVLSRGLPGGLIESDTPMSRF